MKIVVNGEEREMVGGASVTDLLGELKLTPDKVAIEVNRRLVRSDRYGEGLKEGDVVEVVTFVGGG